MGDYSRYVDTIREAEFMVGFKGIALEAEPHDRKTQIKCISSINVLGKPMKQL